MTKHKIDKFIPYFFLLFFLIVFSVDGAFIYLAKKSWRGIQTEDSYQKGIKYNQTLEYAKKQKELGWRAEIKLVNLGNRLSKVSTCIIDQNKKPILNAKIKAKLTRPTQEGYDFEQDFAQEGKCYYATIQFPLKGQWSLEIQAFRDNDIMQEVKKFIIQ